MGKLQITSGEPNKGENSKKSSKRGSIDDIDSCDDDDESIQSSDWKAYICHVELICCCGLQVF